MTTNTLAEGARNQFIESAFSIAKRAPEYPGRFLDDRDAVTYFTRYFNWYDTGCG
jgi:hypothetical protein